MGRAVRTGLSRLSPVSWLGFAALVILQLCGLHSPDGVLMLLASLGVAGTISGAVDATHDACLDMLLQVLLDEQPKPEPHQALRGAA